MAKTFQGSTQNAEAPFLDAAFWTKGKKIEGAVLRKFKTVNGTCLTLSLKKPTKIDGSEEDKVSVGAMAGMNMALQDAGLAGIDDVKEGDVMSIECTGTTPMKGEGKDGTKKNDRTDFTITVVRP